MNEWNLLIQWICKENINWTLLLAEWILNGNCDQWCTYYTENIYLVTLSNEGVGIANGHFILN